MTADRTDLLLGADVLLPDDLRHGIDCEIGHRAVIGSGCVLGDRVRVGPNATVLAPPASADGGVPELHVRNDVTIGAAAVVSGAVVIGVGARVEPGSVVTADVPPHAIVAGNPAQVVGYSSPPGIMSATHDVEQISLPSEVGVRPLLGGAALIRFPIVSDLRGGLTFGEVGGLLPFAVERFFFVFDVPSQSIRGEHAHRTLHEILVCAAGSVRVSLTDGTSRCEVTLDEPSVGLHIPPGVWSTQYRYDPSSVLMVLCSHKYDPTSYIRDFDEFLAEPR